MDVYLCNIIFSLQTLEKYYPKEEVESSLRKTVAFQEEKVTLDIPEAGIILPSGWSIVPMAHPASVSLLCFMHKRMCSILKCYACGQCLAIISHFLLLS